MSNRLKIYACSGLDTKDGSMYKYWLNNTRTVSNTQAVNKLLALINLKYVQAVYYKSLSIPQRAELLDEVDILTVCLYYATNYASDPEYLAHAGEVIGAMVDKGMFQYSSIDGQERDAHLDELIDKLDGLMSEDLTAAADFRKWWKETVLDCNKVLFSKKEQKEITQALEAKSKAISGAEESVILGDPDIGNYITNAGEYFLYNYFSQAQLAKIPSRNRRIFMRKSTTQNNLRSYCEAVFIQKAYGDSEYLDTLIRTGIIKYFGQEPEQVCESIANGEKKIKGVGIATEIIVALIGAAVSILLALIDSICKAVAQVKVAKYESLNQDSLNKGCPNPEDFDGLDMGKDGILSGDSKTILWIGGAAVAAILLFSK